MNANLLLVVGLSVSSLAGAVADLRAEAAGDSSGVSDSPALTPAELADLALERSESLRIDELLLEDARIEAQYAGSWRNPAIELEGGRRRTSGGGLPAILGGGDETNPVFRVTVSQPLFFPGKTALREEAADFRRRLAALSLNERSLLLRYRVIRLAYAQAAADGLIAHTRARVKRFRLIEAYLRGRPALSPARRAEREIVQRRMRTLERGLHELGVSRAILSSRLALYTGEDRDVRVHWIAGPGRSLDPEEIRRLALERSPGLLKAKARVAYAAANERLAARESYPDLEIFGTAEEEPGVERYFGVGVRLALPVFDRNQSAIRRGELRSRAAALALELEDKRLRTMIQAAFSEFEHSREALRHFPLTLEKRTLIEMAAADREFRRGRLELLTYLEADELAFETLRAIYDAQLDYILFRSELLLLAGEARFDADATPPSRKPPEPAREELL